MIHALAFVLRFLELRTGASLAFFMATLVFVVVLYAQRLGDDELARWVLERALLTGLGVSCGYGIGRATRPRSE